MREHGSMRVFSDWNSRLGGDYLRSSGDEGGHDLKEMAQREVKRAC